MHFYMFCAGAFRAVAAHGNRFDSTVRPRLPQKRTPAAGYIPVGGRETLHHHLQGADHAPPHSGHRQRRRFPDRLLRYAGHPETLLQVAGVDDEFRARRPVGRRRAALRDRHRRAGRRTCGRDHRPHPPERSADAGGGQQDRPDDAGGARSARREVARDAARRRNIRSRTRRCVSSPRRSSAKRSCATTTRRSLTAAKSRSRSTARSPASTAFRP